MSARLSPVDLVNMLNRIFSAFDELAETHAVEKIKTVGDAYMVAGGLPGSPANHLPEMAHLALEMLETARSMGPEGTGMPLRIGLHTGSGVAGVIGVRKFIYDVWGDTVNMASRLESHGAPGRVHVSEAVYLRLKPEFTFEARGSIELKGCGSVVTYFLDGPAAGPTAPAVTAARPPS